MSYGSAEKSVTSDEDFDRTGDADDGLEQNRIVRAKYGEDLAVVFEVALFLVEEDSGRWNCSWFLALLKLGKGNDEKREVLERGGHVFCFIFVFFVAWEQA